MTKLRTNHSKNSGGSAIVRVGLFAAVLSALILFFNRYIDNNSTSKEYKTDRISKIDVSKFNFIPNSTTNEVIFNPYFALSYSEEHEQAEWVAYELTAERLNMPWVSRSDAFLPDPQVRRESASSYDYKDSGYDRGHLVPAADMAFSEDAMQYTFLMSNISPQSGNFNKGIWRELEELTRNWAKDDKALYVVTGPVLSETPKGAIGENQVSIPTAYFKVLLDYQEPQKKGIAFIIPNEVSYEPLFKYAVSIDEVEKQTGLDFFSKLISKNEEAELEGKFNIDLWTFSKTKFDLRTRKWNQEQE
ncbi:MAG: DNA/RNA non-specific endonuclease [Saprospiraceae bacterium]|nr:DNA/RNA non-specific endonuclease [Saprospiraceae bacterium]